MHNQNKIYFQCLYNDHDIYFYSQRYLILIHAGCADFVPSMVAQGGMLTPNSYEFLSSPAGHAHQWIQQQQGIRITNIQSIDYKVSSNWGRWQVYLTNFLHMSVQRSVWIVSTYTSFWKYPPPNIFLSFHASFTWRCIVHSLWGESYVSKDRCQSALGPKAA